MLMGAHADCGRATLQHVAHVAYQGHVSCAYLACAHEAANSSAVADLEVAAGL